jgi:hypothetical protein
MKAYLFFFLLLFVFVNGNSQIINREPLSARQTYYRIDAALNTDTKTVSGRMETYWVNKSTDIVPDIQLHLYMNAFKSNISTLNRESGNLKEIKESETGRVDIKKFTDRSGNDLKGKMTFIRPDDGNVNDETVVSVPLPEPSKPGDTVFLNIDFETKLPDLTRRTGYKHDFYFVAQWFPKFGVYESAGTRYAIKGGWNCHQFHALSEFYSDHSVYDVKITVPKEFVVGTCGLQLACDSAAGKKDKTLTLRAEDIVDFAWTAWPGYAIHRDRWHNVAITLLSPGERYDQVERQMSSVKNALEYFNENVGPYPWPYLTIVDPPSIGNPSAGMEYTTLFTSQSSYIMPSWMHMPEMVTIHEFGHAYFMGILASNEFEEPWLDEGVNTFLEERILDHYYGENSGMIDHPLLRLSDKSLGRISYVHSEGRQAVSNKEFSWNYPHETYAMMSYNKTATWLYTLMGVAGEKITNDIFREYYRKWAFRHPSGTDFVNTVNEVVGKANDQKLGSDMNWFFVQTLYGTGLCDYKVSGLSNRKIELPKDTLSSPDSKSKKDRTKPELYESKVELERAGEVMLPVDVLIHYRNGKEVKESWDGKERFKDFLYSDSTEVEWVKVDPDFKIRMDINYNNNSMTINPDLTPVRRMRNKLVSFLQFFISFISL